MAPRNCKFKTERFYSLGLTPGVGYNNIMEGWYGAGLRYGEYQTWDLLVNTDEETVSTDPSTEYMDCGWNSPPQHKSEGFGYQYMRSMEGDQNAHRVMYNNPYRLDRIQLNLGLFGEFGHGDEIFGGGGLQAELSLFLIKPDNPLSVYAAVTAGGEVGLTSHSEGLFSYGGYGLLSVGVDLWNIGE